MVSGGAGALLAPLKAQRIRAQAVTEPEMARAVGGFVDDVEAARLSHDGHPQLAAAVAAARKRQVGLAGSFGWDYRCEGSVLLVSATLARFGAVSAPQQGRRHVRVKTPRETELASHPVRMRGQP